MQYFVKTITAVLFASYDLTNKIGIANSLNKRMSTIFDGEPVILPIPSDAPSEIPRIILASKDQSYRCNVAANQLALIYIEKEKTGKELHGLREGYLTILSDISSTVKAELKSEVFRLGLVVVAHAFPEDPVELIRNTFIREGVLMTPCQLEIHALDKMTWDSLVINRWYRISSIDVMEQQVERKVLSVIFDVNTTPEKRYNFDAEAISAFYSQASAYISENMKVLFPT